MPASPLLVLFVGLSFGAPPELPQLDAPGEEGRDPAAPVAPADPGADPGPGDGDLEDNPEWDAQEAEEPGDPEPEAPDEGESGRGGGGAAGGGAAGGAATGPRPGSTPAPTPAPSPTPQAAAPTPAPVTPQRPSSPAPPPPASSSAETPAPAVASPSSAARPSQPSPQPAPEGPQPHAREPAPDSEGTQAESPDDAKEPRRKKQKLGGWKFFRLGIVAKFGYLSGTSQKEGLFDRDKSIDNAVMTGMVEPTGAGDLGQTRFGGLLYGGVIDAEVIGINVWLDFNKFVNPGGMWSLLLGYDHEIGFNHWLRLDVGGGFGMQKVFIGEALESLYLDRDDPSATNIGTTGMEFRGMADLQFRIAGPLFTGPSAMLGYHYLWSANAEEVTKERGLHFAGNWNLRLDFALRRKKKD